MLAGMSDLQRRPGSGLSRSSRERRAYRLVVVGGTAAAVFVVTLVLALAGVMSGAIPFFALVVAVLCGLLFRRTVQP
jgi:putative flippase GtrA